MTRALAILALALLPAAAHAAPTAPAPAKAKKDRFVAGKTRTTKPAPAPGSKPGKLLNLYNDHTKEWLAIDADDAAAATRAAGPPAQPTVDHFLRDHFTNKSTAMEPRLIGFVLAAAQHFHADEATIVSAFRHPKYNLILRKKGHQVARDSQHTHGNAIDFFLPHVPAAQLAAWARAQKLGGVGFYPDSGFVHMDTGPVRTWSGE